MVGLELEGLASALCGLGGAGEDRAGQPEHQALSIQSSASVLGLRMSKSTFMPITAELQFP